MLKSLLIGVLTLLIGASSAVAQCSGQFPANTFCGNGTGSQALPKPTSITPGVLGNIAGGTVIGNPTGATAAPSATPTPVLGVPGTTLGTVGLAGSTSGTATIRPQATAGSPTLTLPNASGTFAVSATSPLAVSATTGNLTITGSALTKTDDTNVTLTLGGTPTTALLQATSLTLGWTGQLALTRGGTNASLTASNGGIFYSTASAGAILSGTATAGQHLQSGASAAPSWTTATFPGTATSTGTILRADGTNWVATTATYPATTTVNQLLYSSSANVIAGLATGNSGVLITSAGGVPSISSTLPTAVQDNITRLGIIASNAYFASGRPWADVRAYGATGDGSTNDTTAIQAAVSAIQALAQPYGVVYFPPGTYCVKTPGGVTVTTGAVRLVGAGTGTFISACGVDTKVLTLNGRSSTIEQLYIQGANLTTATQPAVSFGSSCTECIISNSYITYGSFALLNAGVDVALSVVDMNASYSTAVIKHVGAGPLYLTRGKIDTTYACGTPAYGATISARANTTGYIVGDVVSRGGFLFQYCTSGTSAGSAPTLQPYGTQTTDGTAAGYLIAPATYYGLQIDNGFAIVDGSDFTGVYTAGVTTTNGTGTPATTVINNSTFGTAFTAGFWGQAGHSVTITNSTSIASCISTGCAGIKLSGSWTGDAVITNNVMLANGYGVDVQTGSRTLIQGNNISGSAIAAINVAANINSVTVQGNDIGTTAAWGANAIALNVAAGTSDYIINSNNNMVGATVGTANAGTGVHQVKSGNVGDTAVGDAIAYGTLVDGTPALSLTATMPTVITAANNAVRYNITTAGSSSQNVRGLRIDLNAGYTGSSNTAAISLSNAAASTGNALFAATGSNATTGNRGIDSSASGTTTGLNAGLVGNASLGDVNAGLVGSAQVAKTGAGDKYNFGVVGTAYNTVTGGSTPYMVGGYFSLNGTVTPAVNAALVADNGAQTEAIFLARDNGSTVFSIADGGAVLATSTIRSNGGFNANGTAGASATVSVRKGDDSGACNLVFSLGLYTSTTC